MNKNKGFTLIEVMIVVAIIGILAAIAYPSYAEQVKQSRRTDAKAGLYRIAQQQEEYFIQNLSYASNTTKLGDSNSALKTLDTSISIDSPEREYSLSIVAVNPANCESDSTKPCTSYTVMASVQNRQAMDDACATMSLNNLGQETAQKKSGGSLIAATARCW